MQIEIKDIKKDTVFWERDKSFTAIEDGYFSGVIEIYKTKYNQYKVRGKCNKTGDIVNFLVTEGHGHYGPSLYTKNMLHIIPEDIINKKHDDDFDNLILCPKFTSDDTVGTGAGDRYLRDNMECYSCGNEWELGKSNTSIPENEDESFVDNYIKGVKRIEDALNLKHLN